MKKHYNKSVTKTDVIKNGNWYQKTQMGPANELRKFHNLIKSNLIDVYAKKYSDCSLIDFACGRGGDLYKWELSFVRKVVGLDFSELSIKEAKVRYNELTSKKPFRSLQNVNFLVMDVAETDVEVELTHLDEQVKYNIASCMFAAHYFFVDEVTLKTFLQNVSQSLEDGGYFIGTIPDGKKIVELLDGIEEFVSPMLSLTKKWKGEPSLFGSPYIFAIKDTVTQANEVGSGSLEYLVDLDTFEKYCLAYNLVSLKECPNELKKLVDPKDTNKTFKHFYNPHYKNTHLSQISEIYTTFVFKKFTK